MYNRLKLAAHDSKTFEEYLDKAKTKNYTKARIKRISLYTLFDITQKMYENVMNLKKDILNWKLGKDTRAEFIEISDKKRVKGGFDEINF